MEEVSHGLWDYTMSWAGVRLCARFVVTGFRMAGRGKCEGMIRRFLVEKTKEGLWLFHPSNHVNVTAKGGEQEGNSSCEEVTEQWCGSLAHSCGALAGRGR